MAARLLKDPATAGSRIFIGHLQTEDMNRNELEEHFSKYGTIVGSLLNRGFGFVQFEDEQSAQNAIKNENGAMFKGRRIDVKPAKKENSGNSMGGFGNDSFNNSYGNQNFNNSNSPFGNDNQFSRGGNSGNNCFNDQEDIFCSRNNNDSFNSNKGNGPPFGGNRSGGGSGNSNMNRNQNNNQCGSNQGGSNQMGGPGNRNRGSRGGKNRKRDSSIGDRMGGGMDDRMGDHCYGDRMGGGMGDRMGGRMGDRMVGDSMGDNHGSNFRSGMSGPMGGGGMGNNLGNNLGGNMGGGLGGNMSGGHGNSLGGGIGNNYRDRSPISRSGRLDDKPLSNWELNKSSGRGSFGGFSDHKSRFDQSVRDSGSGFGAPSSSSNDYSSIATEKNDCEIIVVNKALTEYAEIIESRLKKLGLTVDLLFPNEEVPLSRVLGNIASRGCLYAIVIAPTNKEHHSLTLNILHGLPQVSANVSGNSSVTTSSAVTPSPLLNDPTVQKALDSLLQGNLLKNIGDQPIPTTSAAPLFAAFPNINRF
ncbi:PREDICTED: uncharacterized transmembrane protein DDB_G0289901-like isoform X2 [Ceratosolen solmsi marchali]|uniref:Uncharacterized transmembrane protein DDB_G0289901-like isoform X2 n=1 Tax=Ceratosolen solmsi marchali TaxID=326594 RepID=A0AAJ6YU55_9HYME|nr:PREDICTED: uncharacterized transmembrane protein DDB_G0289901-like isoform X2 [Ceratosolen solmsi marchali]